MNHSLTVWGICKEAITLACFAGGSKPLSVFVINMMLPRCLPALSSAIAPCCVRMAAAATPAYSTQRSTDEIGPGPGSRSRSLEQAQNAQETSTTAGPESTPARSPDAPADPADLAANRGSDPQEVLRSSAWQAQQAMSSSYQSDDQSLGGGVLIKGAPHAAGRLAEKVASAAGIAAQAFTGAASAMSDTVKAATGTSVGRTGQQRVQEVSLDDSPDASPVSDGALEGHTQGLPQTNSDTAARGQPDTATGTPDPELLAQKTKQGGYQEAAERLMDMEGLPKESTGKQST